MSASVSKIVTLYNHKGGVSKTTTTFNLASYLASKGSKVLLVDADPQCNLTQIALAPLIDSVDEESVKKSEIVELPGTSLLDVLNQRVQGDSAFIDINKIELCNVNRSIDLLRGSVDLSSVEDDLAEAHMQRLAQRTNLMRTYVAIGDFLVRLGSKNKYDYIFIDVGPSSGPLTRAFFLVCDYFFVPSAPDRFNVEAVRTLSTILQRWMYEHELIYNSYKSLGLPVRHGKPAFLGLIIQAFKIYKGKPKPAFKLWQQRLPAEVRRVLRPVLQAHSEKDRVLYLPQSEKKVVAASISDFGQLAPLMQEVGKAVFLLDQSDTARISESGKPWQGNNWTDAKKRMERFEASFEQLADILKEVNV
ncbi:ParA family protein [Luteimonas huabeiensis]|uniref:ParA family protein n=1 Tax=Luteimonas huabeiensis TaxID=1244513 RepID=UPI0005BE5B87|nr:AAA family ATPase [Luteimonas huabeiensis]